jgi:hypothetical protein
MILPASPHSDALLRQESSGGTLSPISRANVVHVDSFASFCYQFVNIGT